MDAQEIVEVDPLAPVPEGCFQTARIELFDELRPATVIKLITRGNKTCTISENPADLVSPKKAQDVAVWAVRHRVNMMNQECLILEIHHKPLDGWTISAPRHNEVKTVFSDPTVTAFQISNPVGVEFTVTFQKDQKRILIFNFLFKLRTKLPEWDPIYESET